MLCCRFGKRGSLHIVNACRADAVLHSVQVPNGANGGQPNDTWISGRNGAGAAQLSGQASQDQLNNEQLAAAQGQAGVSAGINLWSDAVSGAWGCQETGHWPIRLSWHSDCTR